MTRVFYKKRHGRIARGILAVSSLALIGSLLWKIGFDLDGGRLREVRTEARACEASRANLSAVVAALQERLAAAESATGVAENAARLREAALLGQLRAEFNAVVAGLRERVASAESATRAAEDAARLRETALLEEVRLALAAASAANSSEVSLAAAHVMPATGIAGIALGHVVSALTGMVVAGTAAALAIALRRRRSIPVTSGPAELASGASNENVVTLQRPTRLAG